jgi:hypothetical protein
VWYGTAGGLKVLQQVRRADQASRHIGGVQTGSNPRGFSVTIHGEL